MRKHKQLRTHTFQKCKMNASTYIRISKWILIDWISQTVANFGNISVKRFPKWIFWNNLILQVGQFWQTSSNFAKILVKRLCSNFVKFRKLERCNKCANLVGLKKAAKWGFTRKKWLRYNLRSPPKFYYIVLESTYIRASFTVEYRRTLPVIYNIILQHPPEFNINIWYFKVISDSSLKN